MNFINTGFKLRFTAHHHPEMPLFRRFEGIQCRGIGFGDKTGSADAIVKNHHHSASFRLRVSRYSHRFQQIHRAIRADCRCRTHRGRKHHRLVAFYGQVKEVRRLIKGVRSVGNHDPIHIIAGQQLVDAF